MSDPLDRLHPTRSAFSVFLASCAIIFLELALMRVLSYTRWHHFSYFVISTALLGYGISGAILTYAGARMLANYATSFILLCLGMAASIAILFPLAESLPIDIQFLLYSGKQVALFALYNLLILIPFTFGATAIGLALMHHKQNLPLIYGCSMLGTAVGGGLAVGLMFLLPELRLILFAALLAWFAAMSLFNMKTHPRFAAVLVLILLIVVFAINPPLKIDQYKTLAMLQRLEKQGDAEHLITRVSPRGHLDAYSSPLLHYTLFAGLGATTAPPPQIAILRDGELAGTVFQINSPDGAPILDYTPASLPYRLLKNPSVLLLGETGSVNIWLARRFNASHITVIQSDPQVIKLMEGVLASQSGDVYSGDDITIICEEPRTFLEKNQDKFDIIQIVTAEGLAAGTSGLQSLHEDFLLTVEGISLARRHLTECGILAVTRGIQTPPRDSLKLFATFAEAIRSDGINKPEMYLAFLRNYLAATILAFKTPVTWEHSTNAALAIDELSLDVEWLPYYSRDFFEPTSMLAGIDENSSSFITEGVDKLLGPTRSAFYNEWKYNIRPATDDSPYFYNFFKWKSLPWLMETYGSHWFRRLELGYVILVIVLIEVIILGAVFILLPLFRLRRAVTIGLPGRIATGLYFLLLGLAFMAMEMTSILRFTRYLGEPVYATSIMIGCFLLSAGLGSVTVGRLKLEPIGAIRSATVAIFALGILHILFADRLMALSITGPYALRALLAVVSTAPLGFFMGWMFPSGLNILSRNAEPLIPWAWGVNGFASVAAPPMALMLSMSLGFRTVLIAAIACYIAAGIIAYGMPRR